MPKPGDCTPTPPAARDNVTGWFIYYCATGVLLTPGAKCVGPECRGAAPGKTLALGYAGDLGAGTKGSFIASGRSIGVTALDGVEIGQSLAAIEQLRARGEIDGYYAAAAKNAYLQRIDERGEREFAFETPSPFGAPLGSGALARVPHLAPGAPVGPSVGEACRCTPRKPDARDPVSGWLIYYVGDGVLLTPTEKCVAGGGRPKGFWAKTWSNTLALVRPTPPPQPVPPRTPEPPAPAPGVPAPPPPTPTGGWLCMDPRVWPPGFRSYVPGPCLPPLIVWPG